MHKTDSCLNILDEMSLVPKAIRCLLEAALTLSLYKRAVSLNRQLGTNKQKTGKLNTTNCLRLQTLKGLSHDIFGPVFWAVWMYLDLNVNRLWFSNFNDAPLILDNYFKF
jgi:hypothetical protein